jgi:hypothetical protein
VRLSQRTRAEVFARRASLDYAEGEQFQGIDLGNALNNHTLAAGLAMRYDVTGLTTVGVSVERERSYFDGDVARDSEAWRVEPMIEFKPFAVINGRASWGIERRKMRSGTLPDFNGSIASADLTYTLLGQTQFTVGVSRQIQYSYLLDITDYVYTGLRLDVTHRLGDSWDVGGSLGRNGLAYRASEIEALEGYNETTITSGLAVGYTLGRTRVGIRFDHWNRDADDTIGFRGYERYRAGATITHRF